MAKKKIRKRIGLYVNTSHELRNQIRTYYIEKFFNKFLSKYEFEGIDYQQQAFIMRQFWAKEIGTVASYVLPMTQTDDNPEGQIIFTPWVVSGLYNIYNFPISIRLINLRAVSFIPNKELKVDEEGGACIGWIQKDKKGIFATIEPMIEKLVDFEMTIRTNLKAQKTPWMFGVDPENETKMQALWDNLDSDDPKLFVPIENLQVAKALVSGATYNIDKLEAQRQQVENEILTRLGVNNVGIMEKKEHFTVDEVNANQEQISSSSDEYLTCMQEFFDRIRTYLKYNITVKLKEIMPMPKEDNNQEEDNQDGE